MTTVFFRSAFHPVWMAGSLLIAWRTK
jgi:hypothetical protein